MFLSARHKPMQRDAFKHKVIDLNTGEMIPRVIWANEETGRYRQSLKDENGKYIIENDRIKSKIFKGKIKLVHV